jgi:hypothetical protein
MSKVRSFLNLPPEERALFVRSLFLMLGVRIGLRLLPFKRILRWLNRNRRSSISREPDFRSVKRVVKFVEKAGDRMNATCLERAVAVQYLLARAGHPAVLRIGVQPPQGGRLLAHAWIEYYGKVIIGGKTANFARYTALPDLGTGS